MNAHTARLHAAYAPDDAPTVGLPFILLQLGKKNFGPRRAVTYVTALIAERDFPAPLPDLRAGRLTGEVTPSSQWRREAVMAWLDDLPPPGVAAALDARARRDAASEMDAAAANLRLVRSR